MLLTVAIENYKGIGEKQYIDFIASAKNEFEDTLYSVNDSLNVNSGLCIVGPNGAGKSHLLHGLYHFSYFISRSESPFKPEPFMLSKKWENKPTKFEALYYCKKIKSFLNYEIEMLNGKVTYEKLVSRLNRKSSKNKVIFERKNNSVKIGRKVNVSEEMINATIDSGASLVKFAKGINIPELKSVFDIASNTVLFTPTMIQDIGHTLVKQMFGCESLGEINDEKKYNELFKSINLNLEICTKLIKSFGVPIDKIELVQVNRELDIFIIPKNIDNDKIRFTLDQARNFYSTGSFNLMVITLLIVGFTPYHSTVLLDEIDGSFHHKLTLGVLEVLRESDARTNSQFVISTHDIMVLDNNFRRDAILTVTKKDDCLETRVSKVSDYSVRKDAKLSQKYFSNEFGALPDILMDN
ncbi:ATP/GTP-binding protein [Vibrio alginolyticus]